MTLRARFLSPPPKSRPDEASTKPPASSWCGRPGSSWGPKGTLLNGMNLSHKLLAGNDLREQAKITTLRLAQTNGAHQRLHFKVGNTLLRMNI